MLLSEARAGSLGVSSLRNRVEVRFEDRPAALPTLLRVHDVQYLMRLIDGCEHAQVSLIVESHAENKPSPHDRHRHLAVLEELPTGETSRADRVFGGRSAVPDLSVEFQNSERFLRRATAWTPHRNQRSSAQSEQPCGYARVLSAE